MNNITFKIMGLLSDNVPINDVQKFFSMSNYEFNMHLKLIVDSGHLHFLKKSIIYDKKEINLDVDKFIVVSDTHLGHNNDRIDLINDVYNYAIKNGIHNIVHTGDFLEGIYPGRETRHSDIYDQADYASNSYPYDSRIRNYILLGNHDYNAFRNFGFCFEFFKRNDLNFLNYAIDDISVKSELIKLKHRIKKYDVNSGKMARIHLHGHSHAFKIDSYGKIVVNVPTLSDVASSGGIPEKGFLVLELFFDNNIAKELSVDFVSLDQISKSNKTLLKLNRTYKNY